MQPFRTVTSIAIPLRRSSVDTDQIVPSEFMKRTSRNGYGDGLFAQWRTDPDFVLNQTSFESSRILVAGPDFGTGSSREHAVWALWDYGFRVVASSRFADIFRSNAGKAGLLCAQLPQNEIEHLWDQIEADPTSPLTVNLSNRTVTDGDRTFSFEIDDYTRWRLLEGIDDIDLTLRHTETISTFEQSRPTWMPHTLPAATESVVEG